MNNTLRGNNFVCRKIKLYNYLSFHGFQPWTTQTDKFNCKRLIWVYRITDELKQAIDNYYLLRN